jgi:hypothetical protein
VEIGQTEVVRLLRPFIVDRLPVDWWRPGNFRTFGRHSVHFCTDNHVRTIEWDSRVIGEGRRMFPYGRWDEPK